MLPTEDTLVAVSQALGRNAVPWFLAALLALLVAVGVLGWMLQRHARPGAGTRVTSVPGFAVRLAVGFGAIVAGGLVFALLAEAIEAGKLLGRLDLVFSTAVREHTSESAVRAFAWLTHLGDPATLTVLGIAVAVALAVRREYTLAAGWVIALAGNAALNSVLKNVFERARPVREQALAVADGWSFPSGHASGSVVAYGMLAYVLVRTLPRRFHLPAMLLAAAIAVATGASRVFLQVHYASDVLAGFASGAAWLAICIGSIGMATHYRRRRTRQPPRS